MTKIVFKKELFLQKLKTQFPEDYDKTVAAIRNPAPLTFRTVKAKADEKATIANLITQGFEITSGPMPNSYIVLDSPPDKKLSETQEFETGKIYIQNLSSMLPAITLSPKPNEKILDLCAAPGSKTTQLADLTNGEAEIVAVENNKARYFRLKENLKKYGFENVQVINTDATQLPKTHPQYLNYFDKTLVDAPCSNEGQINLLNLKSYQHWNPKLPKKIAKLQKRLLVAAIQMLKPKGELIYSTCTFSKEENEEVIEWIVKKFPQIKLIEQKRVYPDGTFTAFYLAKLVL